MSSKNSPSWGVFLSFHLFVQIAFIPDESEDKCCGKTDRNDDNLSW